ncbi:MAG: hypothetical protein HC890_19555 [Chloroflexaceae bacterium]|nr:hypothetical protein [Chloroflexaceae bacterium]
MARTEFLNSPHDSPFNPKISPFTKKFAQLVPKLQDLTPAIANRHSPPPRPSTNPDITKQARTISLSIPLPE